MQRVTLGTFLEGARPWEHWRAPLDPKLREAAILGGISAVATPALLWLLPPIGGLGTTPFFFVFGAQFSGLFALIEFLRPLLVLVDVVTFVLFLAVGSATNEFTAGRREWHRVAFVVAVMGAVSPFVLTVLLGFALFFFLLNLVVWLALALFVLAEIAVIALVTRYAVRRTKK